MAKYPVSISSYDTFRAAVIGKAFDIDGVYGCQCVDGAKLLIDSLGFTAPSSPNGGASGWWDKSYQQNLVKWGFDIIADKAKIKRGDMVIFGETLCKYGHVAYADEDYSAAKTTLKVIGQNQGGTDGKVPGAEFRVGEYKTSCILGAYRLKKWSVASPSLPAFIASSTANGTYNIRDIPSTQGSNVISLLNKSVFYYYIKGISVSMDGEAWRAICDKTGKFLGWSAVK